MLQQKIKIFPEMKREEFILKKDTKKEQYGDFSFMFSINSNKESWPVNVFFSYKLGSQTFYETSIDNILFDAKNWRF